ncbi:MAG: hypothetical protein SFY56_00235 [Bacteroidota bacterium]|nr:hypothetical protein [Bacteroidota bacterium]
MKKVLLSIILFCCISSGLKAFENDLRTISKRPNSNELFVGGEFKTVFVLNAVSGETIRTFTVQGGVEDMVFNPEGNVLISKFSTKLSFINPQTGSVIKTFDERSGKFFLFERSNYVVFVDRYNTKKTKLLSSKDGSLIKEFSCDFEPDFSAISNNDQQMIIFSKEIELKKEKSLLTTEVKPISGYNVYNTAFIRQQSDGKGISYVTVDLKDMALSKTKQIPYSPKDGSYSFNVSWFDGNVFILDYETFIKIDSKDKVYPIELDKAGFSYACASSKDGRYIIQSSTKEGYIYDCKENKSISYNVKGKSQFTYSADICNDNDTLIILAKDYTIVWMNTSGNIIRDYKINRGSNIKFGVYYTNGFNKKELRDKEAAIINKELKALGLPEVDLEKNAGNYNLLIATLDSEDKSNNLQSALKNSGLQYITKIAPIE